MHKRLFIITALGFGLLSSTGCFFKPKPKTSNDSSAVHKNHGQERKEEVHERNDARKAAKDAQKNDKK